MHTERNKAITAKKLKLGKWVEREFNKFLKDERCETDWYKQRKPPHTLQEWCNTSDKTPEKHDYKVNGTAKGVNSGAKNYMTRYISHPPFPSSI